MTDRSTDVLARADHPDQPHRPGLPGLPPAPSPARLPVVLARLRAGFRGTYDAFFYEDRIVLRRVPGRDAERIGGAIGFIAGLGWLGALIGAWIGRRIAAAGNADRICPLQWQPPDVVAANDPKNRVIPYASIAALRVDTENGGAWIRLRETDGRRSRFRCHNIHNPETDVVALLKAVAGDRMVVRRRHLAPLLVVAAATVVAIVLGRFLFTAAFGGEDATSAHARAACSMFVDAGRPTSRDAYFALFTKAGTEMDKAAATDPDFVPAASAIHWMSDTVQTPPAMSAEDLQTQFRAKGAVVDAACAKA